jgi:DNA-binding NtrC family response regulator
MLVLAPDRAAREELESRVRRLGHVAHAVAATEPALEALAGRHVDAVIVEVDAPALPALCDRLVKDWPDVPFIVVEREGDPTISAEGAATGSKAQAADILQRPFSDEELRLALAKAVAESATSAQAPPSEAVDGELLGASKAMQKVHELLRRAASGTATMLIRGESGTGKELVARTLHRLGPRRAKPFIKVHCAALPDTLLESELFGYERGAFTGAMSRKPGRVELAQGGTLFLDEIGDITPAIQVKLLQLLQDRKFERLGGRETIEADVRFVVATHRDLDAMVKQGTFREDLFYRLNVVTTWLPPLRARRDDIAALARRFCAVFGPANGKPNAVLSEDAVLALRSERWPGNVRQLQNFVEKLVVLAEHDRIDASDVARELDLESTTFTTQGSIAPSVVSPPSSGAPNSALPLPLTEELRQTERRALLRALQHTQGNRTLAARLLGISRATLYKKLDEHELS